MEDFSGKTVLVTGAAGGLGRAVALAFAGAGARVAAADVDGAGLDDTAGLIAGRGGEAFASRVDLSSREACIGLVADTVARFGGLDVLCNVAGILGPAHAEQISEALWNRIIAVNLSAPFWLIQAGLPHLLAGSGNIVNVASSGAYVGEAYLAPYTATKAGLVQMTRSLAMEFMKKPVRINCVAPGPMATNMMDGQTFPADVDMELIQRYMAVRPAADPAQVADLVLYLASERAANIHGTCLLSDGGHSAG
ncbi:MAG: SDR family NAD(P)-dependent oxidoreductase [Porticoccaceae bacterium]|jgi:NAD(P)-dependent dehydrogenase (short-subunit alcohol dehydrogenase family)